MFKSRLRPIPEVRTTGAREHHLPKNKKSLRPLSSRDFCYTLVPQGRSLMPNELVCWNFDWTAAGAVATFFTGLVAIAIAIFGSRSEVNKNKKESDLFREIYQRVFRPDIDTWRNSAIEINNSIGNIRFDTISDQGYELHIDMARFLNQQLEKLDPSVALTHLDKMRFLDSSEACRIADVIELVRKCATEIHGVLKTGRWSRNNGPKLQLAASALKTATDNTGWLPL